DAMIGRSSLGRRGRLRLRDRHRRGHRRDDLPHLRLDGPGTPRRGHAAHRDDPRRNGPLRDGRRYHLRVPSAGGAARQAWLRTYPNEGPYPANLIRLVPAKGSERCPIGTICSSSPTVVPRSAASSPRSRQRSMGASTRCRSATRELPPPTSSPPCWSSSARRGHTTSASS